MKKVLFIASHRPGRAPNQRFRFEQYVGFLEENGFRCEISPLLDEKDDRIMYSRGNFFRKAAILARNYAQRLRDYQRADEFDVIFISREALMTRSIIFEKLFARSRANVIYDFDDAIWMNDTSDANKLFKWMKNPSKIAGSIRVADQVFAGNKYLAEYALKYNERVAVIPTTIDTDEYAPLLKQNREGTKPVVIGWSGSLTTIKHFEYALPFLRAIKDEYGDQIAIKVIGDANYRNEELGITGIGWKKETEISELSEIDIGIMPLPDDPWARGKCGLKGLQYMALAIPAVMSPVGVNSFIINEGINGYLARNEADWISKLKQLIDDPELRLRLGKAARKTVEDQYSVKAHRNSYLQWFRKMTE